jgi:hypothetical protein
VGVAPHKPGKSRPAGEADCLSRSIRCDGSGGVSRAAKGADCKSAGYAFAGSSPASPTTLIILRVTITLTGAEDAPTGASLAGGSVSENVANGTVVGTVTGSDPDVGDTLGYRHQGKSGNW